MAIIKMRKVLRKRVVKVSAPKVTASPLLQENCADSIERARARGRRR